MGELYMSSHDVYDELYHHGVKGQKWGVRKKNRPSSVEIHNARAVRDIDRGDLNRITRKLNEASASGNKRKVKKQAEAYQKTKNSIDSNSVIAARMTRGEKIVSVGLTSVLLTPATGLAVAGGIYGRERYLDRKGEHMKGNK